MRVFGTFAKLYDVQTDSPAAASTLKYLKKTIISFAFHRGVNLSIFIPILRVVVASILILPN